MKLQNLSVIFVLIVLPLILVLSYYISLQADTINLQAAYNSKLSDSTKEAIDAFEINTAEWNANTSEVADSKRRDVMASINTFITSFSNNIGIGGTSRENILSYMPAIVYTLYDGYYIYSPADVKPTIRDNNEVAIILNKDLFEGTTPKITGCTYDEANYGKLLYEPRGGVAPDGYYEGQQAFTLDPDKAADAEFKHILKPYAPYSEKIQGTNLVINYTLDNYITIYGELEDGDDDGTNDKYVLKTGYLTAPGKISHPEHNKVEGIKFKDKDKPEVSIEPEILEEQIAYEDNSGNMHVDSFIYVYEAEGNTKVYYDNVRQEFFRLDGTERKWIKDLLEPVYKKCTVPRFNSGEWTYSELYQNLSDGNWYTTEDKEVFHLRYSQDAGDTLPAGMSYNKLYDYSAINYCVESWIFTNWYNTIISGEIGTDNQYYISGTNDPEDEKSAFSLQRRAVIKERVNSDLQQSIASYSRNTPNEYRIPELKEEDWNQVLKNASITTFIQNIPIGMKYYNDYAIATSTINKEYVDPNEIYLNASGQKYYHTPYCTHLGENDLIGYRSVDYLQKSYNTVDATNLPVTKYYFRHANNTNTHINVEEACYSCLIQRAEYVKNETNPKHKAYYTALARERYIARMTKLPPEIEPSYLLHVVMVDEYTGTKVPRGEAEFGINGTKHDDEWHEKIPKDSTPEYIIDAVGEERREELDNLADSNGTLDVPRPTIRNPLTETPTYVSEPASKIKVKINEYRPTGIFIKYFDNQNVEWGSGASDSTYDNIRNAFISSDVGTGYINVKLKYKPNYTVVESRKDVKAWANIDNYNVLTIVTETKGISGRVRLEFISNGVRYYSEETFKIAEGDKIYCRISGDTGWYTNNCTVNVMNTSNHFIAGGEVSYYTIKDATGLKGFANAVNEGAKTEGRTFKVIRDISDVGGIAPIGTTSATEFKGILEGVKDENNPDTPQAHKISKINITPNSSAKYSTDSGRTITYQYFGLFGKTKSGAVVKNITLDQATINLTNVKGVENKNYITGGIVGENNGTLEHVNVSNSTIKGTAYVGGIAGKTTSRILGSEVLNTSVQSVGNVTTRDDNNIYIGGIAGLSDSSIENCKVQSSSNVKYVGTSESNWKISDPRLPTYNMKMYVGGITGRANSTIKNCHVQGSVGSSNVSFSTGNVLDAFNDDVKYYVGGYVGYLGGTITFDRANDREKTLLEDLSVVGGLKSSLYDKDANECYKSYTGGLVGYNNGSEIKNITNRIEVTSTGYTTGGIVGYNNGKNIHHCTNEATIFGRGNVGGIVGWTDGGYIYICGNTGTIKGENNINNPLNDTLKFLGVNFAQWWFSTEGSQCTGTGGISGKTQRATIAESYNHGEIKCNYNGGGMSGTDLNSVFKYCYNRNSVTASERGRVGGICGASVGVQIYSSYNTGNIKGKRGTSVVTIRLIEGFDLEGISYGVGGLVGVGFCNDFRYGTEYQEIDLGLISIRLPYIEHRANQIIVMSSYSSGKVDRRNKQYYWTRYI